MSYANHPRMPRFPPSLLLYLGLAACGGGSSSLPSDQRPSKMINEPNMSDGVTLVPLGTGKGATSVYEGDPSSSFVIKVGDKCRVLVDVGLGVVQQCLRYCGSLPDVIYVSHNHTDHAGELPVLLIVELTKGRKLIVVSAPEVEARLKERRIHELYSTGKTADEIATWVTAPEGAMTRIDDLFSVVTHRGRHSETSYGMVLYHRGIPLLGFSADSGLDDDLYDKLAVAESMVIDARLTSSKEHASFEEITALEHRLGGKRIYVTGYGTPAEGPKMPPRALRVGEPIELWRPAPRVQE